MRRYGPSRVRFGAWRSTIFNLAEAISLGFRVRLGRQQKELGAGGGDRPAHCGDLVDRQLDTSKNLAVLAGL